jgi:S1-C subfamily serine protease
MSFIEELQATATSVAATVGPATVRIGRHGGRGMGVVTGAGLVVTNAHNLRGPTVTVTFADGRTATGEVRGVDGDGDLAVVAVETGTVTGIAWAPPGIGLGTPVWTVTLAPGGDPRVTSGQVSAVGRPFRGPGGRLIAGSLEHTAPLARGSSGGPLLDAEGRLVGLNTHRLGDGFYLALPADAALRARIDGLGEGRAPNRRRLGVALAPPEAAARMRAAVGLDARPGLLVRGVEEDGPAASAGIRRGDLIVSADGVPTAGPDDLYAALAGDVPTLVVGVVRGAEELTVEVTFPTPDGA